MSQPTIRNTPNLHVHSHIIFVRFGRLEFLQTFVKKKSPNIKFQENPSGGSQRIYRRTHTKLAGVLGPRGIQATEADKTKLPSNCPKSITVRTRSKMLNSCSGVGGLEANGGSATQQITHNLQNPKVQHSVH